MRIEFQVSKRYRNGVYTDFHAAKKRWQQNQDQKYDLRVNFQNANVYFYYLKINNMKISLLPVLALLTIQSALAQISLEHTYPYANVRRLNIEDNIFYGAVENNAGNATLRWFDAQHQAFSVVNMTLTTTIANVSISSASTGFYDSDPGIETVLSLFSGAFGNTFIVVDDDGTVLLDKPDGTDRFMLPTVCN